MGIKSVVFLFLQKLETSRRCDTEIHDGANLPIPSAGAPRDNAFPLKFHIGRTSRYTGKEAAKNLRSSQSVRISL